MAIQQVESYYPLDPSAVPRCAIRDCMEQVAAEVYVEDYGPAAELFWQWRWHRKTNKHREGDRRLFLCQQHLDSDPRARQVRWQLWL
jgi:hypothetical protein